MPKYITIWNKTFKIPALEDQSFQDQKLTFMQRQEMVKEGVLKLKPLLGIIPRKPKTLSIDERFHALQSLIKDYDKITEHLRRTRQQYNTFFYADWYATHCYSQGHALNPKGPVRGHARVHRGGSWADPPKILSASYRDMHAPEYWSPTLGFRCAQDTTDE